MRIGVLTFHRAYNCGAALQAWALKTVLERMGHSVVFPVCNHVGERPRWPESWFGPFRPGLRWGVDLFRRWRSNLMSIPNEGVLINRYVAFRKAHFPELEASDDAIIQHLESHCDRVVVGSDQVWSFKHIMDRAPWFLGEVFTSQIKRKAIAYAVSYGDAPLDSGQINRVCKCLANFRAVSVREKLAADQIYSTSGRRVAEVLDPALLVTAVDFDLIADGEVPQEEYLFVYTLFASEAIVTVAKTLARILGVRPIIAPCYQFSRSGAQKGLTYSISPGRLVQYAKHAKYVVSGSFHGTVMAVTFHKPFLVLRDKAEQFESRPAALVRKLGCEERLANLTIPVDVLCAKLVAPLPDYSQRLSELRAESLAWLKGAIDD